MTFSPIPQDWRAGLASLAVFLLPALVLTTSFGIGLVEFFVLMCVCCCGGTLWKRRRELFGEARMIGFAFLLQFVLVVASLAATGFEPHFLENPGKQLLAAAVIGLVALTRPRAAWFWPGLFVGAVGAAVLASYQRFGLDVSRVEGFHMAISFGDISMTLGLMSLASIERFAGTRWKLLPYVACLSGVAASILSGSRGGWIALMSSFVPLYLYGKPAMRRGIAAIVVVTILLFTGGYFLPESRVHARVAEAVTDVLQYRVGNAATSVGARFEMWKGAWIMFEEHPLFGVGRTRYHAALSELIDHGRINAAVRDYHHAHNEMLQALATEGLPGAFALLFLYAAPLTFFVRCLRRDDVSKPYALAGMLLVLSYIDFGLTQVLSAHHVDSAFFALTVCVLAGLCMPAGREVRVSTAEAKGVRTLHA